MVGGEFVNFVLIATVEFTNDHNAASVSSLAAG